MQWRGKQSSPGLVFFTAHMDVLTVVRSSTFPPPAVLQVNSQKISQWTPCWKSARPCVASTDRATTSSRLFPANLLPKGSTNSGVLFGLASSLAYLSRSSLCFPSSLPLSPFQSQTSAAGQGDVPLNPEEFNVGETTGEKCLTFPGLQSASACLPPSLLCLRSLQLLVRSSLSSHQRHTLQLEVGCRLSLQSYLLLCGFCRNPQGGSSSGL